MALMRVFFLVALWMAFAPVTASAQEGDPALSARVELARELHEIRPLDDHITAAIRDISQRYPEAQRGVFVERMERAFDSERLTALSVDVMAETFTDAELQAMISYFGSPEGQSISEKMPVYQALLEPQLVRLIDQAMMDLRAGRSAP